MVLRNLPGVPTKQNGGKSRARGFKRSSAQNRAAVQDGKSLYETVINVVKGGKDEWRMVIGET